jgi:regulatory Fis family protein
MLEQMRATLTNPGEYTSPRSRGEVWHLHRIILPRRSITGRLLIGLVWRRRDRRRWIYKKFERNER